MLIPSKIQTACAWLKRMSDKTKQSVARAAGWFCRGYIITKIKNVGRTVHDTFVMSTHGGYVDKGLVRVDGRQLVAYVSDIDGTDLVDSFKTYVSNLKEKYPDVSPAIKVFSFSGVMGMYARTECMFVMVYGGVPYILPVHRSLEGIDELDAKFSSGINRLLTSVSNADFNHVVSLGYVDSTVNVNEYVLNWAKKSPMFDSADIDPSLVKMAIKDGTISTMGSLYLPGGYLYDIYAIDPLLSRTLRPYRDFTQSTEIHNGREVLLVGGDPDIVYIGTQAGPDGFLYDVWVPNDARYYTIAKGVVDENRLPLGSFAVTDDDYFKSYALLMKMLHELDEEANGPADDNTSPGIMVNPDDEDTETDEVPVLIELPEYLM